MAAINKLENNMDTNTVGVFVIISFLLIGLIVMGCMLYWNWSHRKQRNAEDSDNISNGNACIYEKNHQRAYNRSSKCDFLFFSFKYKTTLASFFSTINLLFVFLSIQNIFFTVIYYFQQHLFCNRPEKKKHSFLIWFDCVF